MRDNSAIRHGIEATKGGVPMKRTILFISAFALVFFLQEMPTFPQHGGGGHGAGSGLGSGAGSGMDQGRGRNPSSSSKLGDNTESARETTKTPEQLLTQNSKLSQNLAKLLPPGTNLETAAQGFKNLGQFVAAVHVSHNLDIPFSELRTKILSGDSLGEAIGDLKPSVNSKDEAKKAKRQAKETMRGTGS
jgi:hypothetical protein